MASNFAIVKAVILERANNGHLTASDRTITLYLNKLTVLSIAASSFIENGSVIRLNAPVLATSALGDREESNHILTRESPETMAALLSFEIANPVVPE